MEIFDFLINFVAHFIDWLPTLPVDAVFAGAGLRQNALDFAQTSVSNSCDIYLGIGTTMMSVFGGGSSFAKAMDKAIFSQLYSLMAPMQSIGIVIALALWLFNIIELAIQDRLTPETLIKSLARLAISALMVDIAPTLFKGIKNFGDDFMFDLAKLPEAVSGDVQNTLAEYWAAIEASDATYVVIFLETLAFLIPINLTGVVLYAITYVVAISRLLELNIRGVFLPIAIGMLADDGWKGAGGRYIRKFIAVVAQGGVLLAIGIVTNSVMTAAMTASMDISDKSNIASVAMALILVVACGIASISIMFKSIGIANDVFGG